MKLHTWRMQELAWNRPFPAMNIPQRSFLPRTHFFFAEERRFKLFEIFRGKFVFFISTTYIVRSCVFKNWWIVEKLRGKKKSTNNVWFGDLASHDSIPRRFSRSFKSFVPYRTSLSDTSWIYLAEKIHDRTESAWIAPGAHSLDVRVFSSVRSLLHWYNTLDQTRMSPYSGCYRDEKRCFRTCRIKPVKALDGPPD